MATMKIISEDEKIKDSEDFLFEFEGFLYYTETYVSGRERIEAQKIKEKRLGVHRKGMSISNRDFVEILKAYLNSIIIQC